MTIGLVFVLGGAFCVSGCGKKDDGAGRTDGAESESAGGWREPVAATFVPYAFRDTENRLVETTAFAVARHETLDGGLTTFWLMPMPGRAKPYSAISLKVPVKEEGQKGAMARFVKRIEGTEIRVSGNERFRVAGQGR